MTGLLGERWRGAVNTVEIDPDSENSVIVQAVIPYNVGGWFIREWGLYDAAGDLVAYGPHAEFYKPVLDSGSGAELLERIKLPISNQGQIKLVVSSDVLATRDYVDKAVGKVAEIVESLRNSRQAAWSTTSEIAENGELVLPEGLFYLPGHDAIVALAWGGLLCHVGQHFLELGDEGTPSDRVQLLFPAPSGSEFYIHIAGHSGADPLAGADTATMLALARRMHILEQQISNVADSTAYVAAP